MASWENTRFGNESRVKFNELVKVVDYRNVKRFKDFRFLGDLRMYATILLPIYKDGKPVPKKKGQGNLMIPFNVTNFDPKTEKFDDTKKCPFVEAAEKMAKYMEPDEAKQLNIRIGHYAEAINRDLQENPDKKGKPSQAERKSGLKESLDSASFTPLEVHQINFTIGQHLESIKETNTVKNKATGEKVAKSVADPKFGRDVKIKYDEDGKGQAKYKVVGGERTPLTEEEQAYLHWDIVGALKATTMSTKDAKVEADRILKEFMKSVKKKKSNDDEDDDEGDMPDDIESPVKKKSSKKAKKPDPDEDDDEDGDDDLEDLESPVAKKSSNKKMKTKSKYNDDDDDEDENSDEDGDEDEPFSPDSPVKKKKGDKDKKSSSKKAKRPDPDEDEDEDEDELDVDLEDEDD